MYRMWIAMTKYIYIYICKSNCIHHVIYIYICEGWNGIDNTSGNIPWSRAELLRKTSADPLQTFRRAHKISFVLGWTHEDSAHELSWAPNSWEVLRSARMRTCLTGTRHMRYCLMSLASWPVVAWRLVSQGLISPVPSEAVMRNAVMRAWMRDALECRGVMARKQYRYSPPVNL